MLLNFTSNQGILRAGKENVIMPNIKPISDLRNYSDVLRDVSVGAPVFLTKNGRGRNLRYYQGKWFLFIQL